MDALVRVLRPSTGPRLYVLGARLHHGLTGAALCALGAVLMVHDRRDWPWPVRDRKAAP